MLKRFLTVNILVIVLTAVFIFTIKPAAMATGIFGPLQTVSKEAGGLNTAIGYVYHEDTYKNGVDHTVRLNEIYSQAAYGAKNIWEIYARVGLADMKIVDVFSSTDTSVKTDRNNFEANWEFFGTLGAKAFYPINSILGIGAFVQGTYYFSNFVDTVSGTEGGAPFISELKIKNFWNANFGVGIQATLPLGIKVYAGPYVYYSEAEVSLHSCVSGSEYRVEDDTIRNKAIVGGFTGVDIPLVKGFRLNVEGQFTDRFSAGAAVSYTY
ncbi:hypothetical protein ASZ90_007609 [hydrocarbon metagenome]|uniref:Outer membrane protein beta-barrel domain-containing protein n=1 Tax=hydrocarbon metagenome TaxID=938273 RepID=A0A0W8FP35_9ZZZZ